MIKNAVTDWITRSNVYKFDGAENFEVTLQHLKETIIESDPTCAPEVIDYYFVLARFYVFEIDPDREDLEAEKEQVQEESRKA